MEDLNFDDLLAELEEEVNEKEPKDTKEQTEPKEESGNDADLDSLGSDIPDIQPDVPGDGEPLDDTAGSTPTGAEELIKQLKEEIEKLKGALEVAEKMQTEETVEEINIDDLPFKDETESFLKQYAELEFDKKNYLDEYRETMKDLKKNAEDQGVNTKLAIKAWKEYQQQLKETAEEAKEQEQIRTLVQKNDRLSTLAAAMTD